MIFSDNLSVSRPLNLMHQVSRSESYVRGVMNAQGFQLKSVIPMFVLMNDPGRNQSKILRKLYSLTSRLAARSELTVRLIGAILYPLDILLLRFLKRGPSTEIFVWKKLADVD